MERPDVSVLIVNYNVKDYLLQCLRSIEQRMAGVDVEVIVVDNCSDDNSVAELEPLFPWVTWIPLSRNVGFGRGNNAGLSHCNGRYVLFLNPDTIIAQDTLNVMVRYMDDHADVGMAGCKVLNPDGTFQLACRRGFPTPWASFCKLFGLQSLFPNSPLFAQYNQTFRSVDETYEIDALIGAFMIGRTDDVRALGGFDPDFFMYGEDLDLCYRVQKTGRKIMYVHETSIVHFKGESTKRSSMNEVQVFYQAMRIFARKHFGGSPLFLLFLRLGIVLRAGLERVLRRKRELAIAFFDLLAINGALMAATAIRFDGPFGFPDYAYPTVFIVISVVMLCSMMAVGEYVEHRPTMRRSIVGLLVTFFMLSSLTYFFKQFAFSRGVLLMTIGFSVILFAIIRGAAAVAETVVGGRKTRRIVLVGLNERTERIVQALHGAEHRNAEIVGVAAHGAYAGDTFVGYPVLGTTDYLAKLVAMHGITEVIMTDRNVGQAEIMRLMAACSADRVRFHMAADYDEIVTARIINEVAGIEPTVKVSPLTTFRNRTVKRAVDIIAAIFVLLLHLPGLILGLASTRTRKNVSQWSMVLRGTYSVVGLYADGIQRNVGKEGITGLVHISTPAALSPSAIEQLNDFYVEQYSIALDIEILLKHLLRRIRG